jgi:predicted ATP-grasp superfamily ATP-dependent carboligase
MKILLAGISTRALARSAAAAGAQVVSLDFFGDCDQPPGAAVFALGRDLRRPLELRALAEEAQRLAPTVDTVIVESGLENEPALTEVGRPEQRWFNPGEAVRRSRDLRGLAPILAGSGLALPDIVLPGERLPGTGRWLVKDGLHSGGWGVRDWDGRRALKSAEILERFLPGTLASACFAADGKDARLLGLTRQYAGVRALGAARYAWCGNMAPWGREDLEETILVALQRLVPACKLVGLNGIDFIVGSKGPVLLEINPRPPASFELFERLLRVNAFRLHVDGCQGRLVTSLPRPQAGIAWGKGILYARRELRVDDTAGWQEQGIADIPHEGEIIPKGAPVCTLLASAASASVCWQRVLETAARTGARF